MVEMHLYHTGSGYPGLSNHFALGYTTRNYAFGAVTAGSDLIDRTESDVGPRMLALSAREVAKLARNAPMDYRQFGLTCIRRADTNMGLYPSLTPEYLDASLSTFWIEDGDLKGFIFGNGLFIHRTKHDLRCIHVKHFVRNDLKTNGVAYLSYLLDEKRRDDYEELGALKEVWDGIASVNGTLHSLFSGSSKILKPNESVTLNARVCPGDTVMLVTDGIHKFVRDGHPVEWNAMVTHLLALMQDSSVYAFNEALTKLQFTRPALAISMISVL